jgi:hypothetical protein
VPYGLIRAPIPGHSVPESPPETGLVASCWAPTGLPHRPFTHGPRRRSGTGRCRKQRTGPLIQSLAALRPRRNRTHVHYPNHRPLVRDPARRHHAGLPRPDSGGGTCTEGQRRDGPRFPGCAVTKGTTFIPRRGPRLPGAVTSSTAATAGSMWAAGPAGWSSLAWSTENVAQTWARSTTEIRRVQ